VIGSEGNDNTAKLIFSNNPNATGSGDNTKTTTPEDKNIVFTYEVDINKFNEKNEPLAGATFKLYKKVSDTETTGAKTGGAIKAELGTDIKAGALQDDVYYILVDTVDATKAAGKTNYTASFQRVDDGDYVLVESGVPTGYNPWESKSFTIEATHTQDTDQSAPLTLTDLKATGDLEMTGNVATGSMSKDIVNQSGSVLPSTGGIGTTIFYVLGGLLVVGAGIVLVARKNAAE
jgi:LPXTG-motif cell wall-anchored protein